MTVKPNSTGSLLPELTRKMQHHPFEVEALFGFTVIWNRVAHAFALNIAVMRAKPMVRVDRLYD
jgi:hypothetical protein